MFKQRIEDSSGVEQTEDSSRLTPEILARELNNTMAILNCRNEGLGPQVWKQQVELIERLFPQMMRLQMAERQKYVSILGKLGHFNAVDRLEGKKIKMW